MRLSLPAGWLGAAGRVFPVLLDPTVSVWTQDNTYIEGGPDANSNYGTASVLYAGHDGTANVGVHGLPVLSATLVPGKAKPNALKPGPLATRRARLRPAAHETTLLSS